MLIIPITLIWNYLLEPTDSNDSCIRQNISPPSPSFSLSLPSFVLSLSLSPSLPCSFVFPCRRSSPPSCRLPLVHLPFFVLSCPRSHCLFALVHTVVFSSRYCFICLSSPSSMFLSLHRPSVKPWTSNTLYVVLPFSCTFKSVLEKVTLADVNIFLGYICWETTFGRNLMDKSIAGIYVLA